jgi:hypothetical protein
MDPVGFLLGFAAFMVFLIGLLYALMGIMILVSTAGHRAKRRAGHDAFFIATKLHEQYLADLEKKDSGVPPPDTGA